MHFLLLSLYFLAASLPPLVPADVPVKLHEVTALHSYYKKIEPVLVGRSIELYCEELDPLRCYFLQSEVDVWRSYPVDALRKEVTSGNLSLFFRIYDAYGAAIRRRRSLEVTQDENLMREDTAWPRTEKELAGRIREITKRQEEGLDEQDYEIILKKRGQREAFFLDQEVRVRHVSYLALKCLTAAFDSHTRYFSPQETESFLVEVKQQFYGIGIQLREGSGGFTVVKVYEEGPAFGRLFEGDVLVAIDGEQITSLELQDVVRLLKMPTQRPVRLTLQSQKEVFIEKKEVILKENRISTEVFQADHGGLILHLSLHSFYQNSCSRDVEQAIKSAGPQLQGVILDLRENMGGLLPEAISLAGLFLDPCAVVAIKDQSGSVHVFHDKEGKNIFSGPIVILVDHLSASASELVAGALQDWGRAIIVGDPCTYGKGTCQLFTYDKQIDPLGEFKITMGCYYTASGRTVQLHGVTPDIIVPGPYASLKIGEDQTRYPLPADWIPPFYEEKSSWFGKKQQRLTGFTEHLPALRQLKLPEDPLLAAKMIMNALIKMDVDK